MKYLVKVPTQRPPLWGLEPVFPALQADCFIHSATHHVMRAKLKNRPFRVVSLCTLTSSASYPVNMSPRIIISDLSFTRSDHRLLLML